MGEEDEPMECRGFRQHWTDWREGWLDTDGAAMAAHRQTCRDCARYDRQMAGLVESLGNLPMPDTPPRTANRIMLKPLKLSALTVSLVLFGTAGPVWAQEDVNDVDDVEMEVVEDPDAGEMAYVADIELPDSASDQAVESAAAGLGTANEARDDGRSFGQDTAREAREAREVRETGRDAANARRAAPGAPENRPGNRPVDVQ